jgi:hypothetical protein
MSNVLEMNAERHLLPSSNCMSGVQLTGRSADPKCDFPAVAEMATIPPYRIVCGAQMMGFLHLKESERFNPHTVTAF